MTKEEILQRLVEIYNTTDTQSELAEEIYLFIENDLKKDRELLNLKLRSNW